MVAQNDARRLQATDQSRGWVHAGAYRPIITPLSAAGSRFVPTWPWSLLYRLVSTLPLGRGPAIADYVDDELCEAFLGELSELSSSSTEALQAWRQDPANPSHPTVVSRTFHTLKGSAPIIGAHALAELGQVGEDRMQHLIGRPTRDEQQIQAIEQAIALLPAWIDAISKRGRIPAGTRRAITRLK